MIRLADVGVAALSRRTSVHAADDSKMAIPPKLPILSLVVAKTGSFNRPPMLRAIGPDRNAWPANRRHARLKNEQSRLTGGNSIR
jgi:hypothetical protein